MGDLLIDLQEYLTREPGYRVWAPTALSYTLLTLTGLLFVVGLFGLIHFLIAMKAKSEFPGVFWSFTMTFGSAILIPLLLLSMPLTMDNYIAADDQGFYQDPYFGFEPDVYPWKDSRVILDYSYYEDPEEGRKLGIHYIIQSGNKEYDLWWELLNNDPHSEEQFQAVKEIDGIAREHGVPFIVKRKIGASELDLMMHMMQDGNLTPEEIDFVKKIFDVK